MNFLSPAANISDFFIFYNAADTLPVLACFLALFHIAFVIPLLILTGTTESTEYECNEKFAVRFTLFSILALYSISFFNEVVVMFLGLRGGPLEVKRRRAVTPLLHLEVILWICILGMTCFGTYIGVSNRVGQSCWSQNPCEYSIDVIPAACTWNKTGDVALSPSCLGIWDSPNEFNDCFIEWVNYGATTLVNNYEYSVPNPLYESDPVNEYLLKPYFRAVNPDTYQCGDTVKYDSKQYGAFMVEAFGQGALENEKSLEEWQKQQENLALAYELYMLRALNVSHTNTTAGSDAPWFKCFTPECQAWIKDGDLCTEWRTMVNIPPAGNRKKAYLATVYASWVILVVQALVVFIAFNAWQNYENEESWEGTTRGFGRFLGCGKNLEQAETEGGTSAAKEIGSLLHMLFGGIDLDPTDQFLGMYLVSERQRLRRHAHVLEILKEGGIEAAPRKASMRKACCAALFRNPSRRFIDWFHRRDDVDLVATLEGPDVIETMGDGSGGSGSVSGEDKDGSSNDGAENAIVTTVTSMKSASSLKNNTSINGASSTPAIGAGQTTTKVHFGELPPSPFDAIAENTEMGSTNANATILSPTTTNTTITGKKSKNSSTSTSSSKFSQGRSRGARGGKSLVYTPPAIAHSFVRLVSLRPSSSLNKDPTTAISITESALKQKLVVEEQNRPLTTPVTLHSLSTRLPVSSYEAAVLYGLGQKPPVDKALLQKALDISMFAKAAYGLQSVKWAYASETAGGCNKTYDSLLSCAFCSPCRKPLGFDSHFRKRNFNAILNLTGIEPSDLLYVSYTCAAFGVLPYMVVLHRPTRSVVVSVRGTVGFDDLITDLLSNPVDCTDVVPEWVRNELADKQDATMYAHSGILSSTRAVLKDLEENGLLAAMLKTASGSISGSSSTMGMSNGDNSKKINRSSGGASSKEVPPVAAFVRQGSKLADRSASNNKILHRLRTLDDDDQIDLDLNRAQSVVDEAINNQGWNVVVTGHSLGAAVACMMSFDLRQYFPTLQCVAFCPPGGLISPSLADVAKQFCTSVVVGCDAITRVSFPNTQRVVDDMVLALARCKRPKLAILMDAIVGRRKNPETTPPTFCAFDDIGPEAQSALKKYVASSKLHAKDADKRELYPPGKIIHLRPFAATGEKGKSVKNDVWDAVWVSGEDLIAEGLILTLNMLRHHRVPALQAALGSAIRDEAVHTMRPDFILESQRGSLVSNFSGDGGVDRDSVDVDSGVNNDKSGADVPPELDAV
jgi:Lipase (class 3)